MENGHINKEGARQLVKEALDRLNSDAVKSIQQDNVASKEIESARILLEIVLRDYLR